MTSKIKRTKQACPKRQATKRPAKGLGLSEPWWERLSRTKRSPCNTDVYRSFNWWHTQKECDCTRDCIHEMANQLSARCVDLEASADRLSKPSVPPCVLSPERRRFRSFNWWRACRSKNLAPPIAPIAQVSPRLTAPRRRPGSPERGSDSSSTAEKVYRTFSWWRPSRADCGRAGRRTPGGAVRSLSLDSRSPGAGGDERNERRERSLSPTRRVRGADAAACPLFRSFSWWQLPTERRARSDAGSPPTKLRRRVSFNFGEGDASGDSSPGAGDVTPGWKRTVVDSRESEQRAVPVQPPAPPAPCRQKPRPRPDQFNCAAVLKAAAPTTGGSGDKHTPTAGRVRKPPQQKAKHAKAPVKHAKPTAAPAAKKKSPPRAKSPGRSKQRGRSQSPGRSKKRGRSKSPKGSKSPPRSKSPKRSKSPPASKTSPRHESPKQRGVHFSPRSRSPSPKRTPPKQPKTPPKSESESVDSDVTESTVTSSSTASTSSRTSGTGRTSSRGSSASPRKATSEQAAPAAAARPGSGSRGSTRPGSSGRGSPRPASAGRRGSTQRPQSPATRTVPSVPEVTARPSLGVLRSLKGWLAAARRLARSTFTLPRVSKNTACVLAAGLMSVAIGYVSANHWEDIEEMLGLAPEDPCGKPENTYFCI